MSIFQTKILLATDGSEEARQAAQAAAELSKDTGSELHVTYGRSRGGQPDRGGHDARLCPAQDRALTLFPALGGARDESGRTPGVDRSGQLLYRPGRVFE